MGMLISGFGLAGGLSLCVISSNPVNVAPQTIFLQTMIVLEIKGDISFEPLLIRGPPQSGQGRFIFLPGIVTRMIRHSMDDVDNARMADIILD